MNIILKDACNFGWASSFKNKLINRDKFAQKNNQKIETIANSWNTLNLIT